MNPPYSFATAQTFAPFLDKQTKGVLINILIRGITGKSGERVVRSLMPYNALVTWRKSELLIDVRDLILRAERA